MSTPARLALEDGSIFRGQAFGAADRQIAQAAEVVFNTAMSGYQEAITDPSYAGQILVFTAPLIGNTGVNDEDVESSKVQVAGMVVRELARVHSNFRAASDLSSYLARSGVLGLTGIDTRALTKRLRVRGVMRGVITDIAESQLTDDQLVAAARNAPDMAGRNLVPLVGCSGSSSWSETLGDWTPAQTRGTPPSQRGTPVPERGARPSQRGAPPRTRETPPQKRDDTNRVFRVLALDCGAKRNILRILADRGCEVTVVPHDIASSEIRERFRRGEADGLFVSNGPGDPAAVENTIATLREIVGNPRETVPTFGICLGHQLLGLALGAKTFKLKFGHRGLNQPVLNLITGRVEITSQNHGFAVDPDSLKAVGGTPTHINLNDGTLAGFCMTDRPVFAVQHHPEASPGPHDAGYLFDAFIQAMSDRKPLSTQKLQKMASAQNRTRREPAVGTNATK